MTISGYRKNVISSICGGRLGVKKNFLKNEKNNKTICKPRHSATSVYLTSVNK